MADHPEADRDEPIAFHVTRRTLLRGGLLGGVGLAAAALIGCGGDDDDDDDDGGETAAVATATQAAAAADDGDDSATPEPTATVEVAGAVAQTARSEGFTYESGRFVPFQIQEPDKPAKSGGTLVQRFTFDPGPLDAAVAAAGGTMTGVNVVYSRLLGVYSEWDSDPYARNELVPELADAWEISEDGLTYTFTCGRA